MKAALGLAAAVIAGLVVGGGIGFLAGTPGQGRMSTVTTTFTTTATSGATSSLASGVDLAAALNNTVSPPLSVTSYSFGKGTLTVWVMNNGSEPVVITVHVPLLNGTTDSVSSLISLDSNVLHIGAYLYVPPNGTFIVSLDAGSYLPGQRGVLSIYGDQWTFIYGTQKD